MQFDYTHGQPFVQLLASLVLCAANWPGDLVAAWVKCLLAFRVVLSPTSTGTVDIFHVLLRIFL